MTVETVDGVAVITLNRPARLNAFTGAMGAGLGRAYAACDADDGVKDGIIGEPLSCKFDPAVLQCDGADHADCLTKSQVAAVRAIYDGAKNPRTGERLYSGWVRGSEAGWSSYFVGQREPARLDFWRYWVFNDPNWDFRSFDFDRDGRLDLFVARYLSWDFSDVLCGAESPAIGRIAIPTGS